MMKGAIDDTFIQQKKSIEYMLESSILKNIYALEKRKISEINIGFYTAETIGIGTLACLKMLTRPGKLQDMTFVTRIILHMFQ